MKYLVVTSRGPFSHEKKGKNETIENNVGGVATALKMLLSKNGGTWVCWGSGSLDINYKSENFSNYVIKRIILNSTEKKKFYDEYSNGTLWPVFHYFRDRTTFYKDAFRYYLEVNRKFAREVIENIDDDTVIWIHDYQLAMLPGILRESNVKNKIIFTWHIPWVSPEFFSIIPESREIIKSISSSNYITFHIDNYRENFINSQRFLLGSSTPSRVYSIPLGIDTKFFSPKNAKKINNIKAKIIFSIDRLDYTKGLTLRVLAIEDLLTEHPELLKKFVYIMNVTPSRTTVSEYINMKKELEMSVGRVNGRFGTIDWRPIIYMYRKIRDKTLLSYYKSADVALITPLIDGLNLVSKEFVATTENGVLIISRFAGASKELSSAITVNPYNIKETANAIIKALSMDVNERNNMISKLKNTVVKRDIKWWYRRITALPR
ncbi:trehalose-6-phosphate synthase [Picrophilus oshimae]|uniref:UDP-forming alpha,alpha-trehalose-phosphate synthase n=1 Tax=Picrophilus torridus (strain ATCC 700027 / DSM 9790 / JCM 10055 / NBRC 100828 / KAW 2/3) TaxID=1122961 RepID=Q6KZQ8_PICTO|nr:trehalose-6-phosphate synthase [Picrophilus oshimae]AAT43794.1 UDP-forming alpha,alpha-trehalose-phosphate synthase [Picrophilus oshimae DSM 9789]